MGKGSLDLPPCYFSNPRKLICPFQNHNTMYNTSKHLEPHGSISCLISNKKKGTEERFKFPLLTYYDDLILLFITVSSFSSLKDAIASPLFLISSLLPTQQPSSNSEPHPEFRCTLNITMSTPWARPNPCYTAHQKKTH